MLEKGGSNWVEGSKFFDREAELETLEERIRGGTHTLLTAQRRMGKTSLVRELLRRLRETGDFDTVFVDLEAAMGPADAIAEVGIRTKSIRGASSRKNETFANKWGISIGRNGEIQSVSTQGQRRPRPQWTDKESYIDLGCMSYYDSPSKIA